MTSLAIEISRLQIQRDRRVILSLDRLAVPAGEAWVVLGPNGAGKSTLLKCLVGVVRPAPGSVHVLGEDVGAMRALAITQLRRRVAYLAQMLAPGSEMPLTLREVVAIGRTGRAGLLYPLMRQDWQRVDDWIHRLGLAPIARQPYSALSGGEQRKALLAMAMVQEPEILLLDEPTANLDAFWREQIVLTLATLHREQSLTTVMVCHDLEAIGAATDQALVLVGGKVVAQGHCRDVLTQDRIKMLYGDGLDVLCHNGRYVLIPRTLESRP
jgi:ABC-type cobalamin/Fe3+-siderophores transport system ATPase subunit